MFEKFDIIEYLKIVVRWRKFIIRNVILVTFLTIIVSLILTHEFRASTIILPPSPEQNAMMGLLSSSLTSSLADVAGISSMLPGFATPSDLFAAILQSGRIKSAIINKYNLKKEFKIKTMTDASKVLEDMTKIAVTPEGLISVSVVYKNKYLAADIANSYIDELDKFNRETAMTVGKKYRIFMETRLQQVIDSLAHAEVVLKAFQEKNRTIALDLELQSAIEAAAKLKGEIMLREVQKGAAGSYNASNPYITNLERELSELKKQLRKIQFGDNDTIQKSFGAGFATPFSKLPEVSLEYARLLRDVKIQEVLYELLSQQYEQAKIMEAKDTPTVQILDKASPPEKRIWPRRTILVLIFFFSSFFVSVLIVFVVEAYRRKPLPAAQKESLAYIKDSLSNDFNNIRKYINRLFARLFKSRH